jgi:hypothetical protein
MRRRRDGAGRKTATKNERKKAGGGTMARKRRPADVAK